MGNSSFINPLYLMVLICFLLIFIYFDYGNEYTVGKYTERNNDIPPCSCPPCILATVPPKKENCQETNHTNRMKSTVLYTSDIDNGILSLRNLTMAILDQMSFHNMSEERKSVFKSIPARLRALELANEGLKSLYQYEGEEISKQLSKKVQDAFYLSQNPKDCKKARKLFCHVNHLCGFGCMSHHLALCFSIAVGTKRTLVAKLNNFGYNRDKGWEVMFQPLSETCNTFAENISAITEWKGDRDVELTNDTLTKITINSAINPNSKFAANTIPVDLIERIKQFHSHPALWYIGQLMKFVLRTKPAAEKQINETISAMDIPSPCVGIQVRRTDKLAKEAKLVALDLYMVHALEWYDKYQLKKFGSNVPTSFVRNIYIATDDDSIFSEANQKYPNINFITNGMITKKAAVNSRYSDDGLVGIVADVRVLSHCDYVVCTMSSNVCRLVYELMQTLHTDASKRLHSLDKSYYFIGQWMHLQIAMYNYTKTPGTKELDIQAGDHLNSDSRIIFGVTTWRGTNLRTWKTGRYHTHMVREYSVAAPYSLLPPIDDESEH